MSFAGGSKAHIELRTVISHWQPLFYLSIQVLMCHKSQMYFASLLEYSNTDCDPNWR